jgi:hypothetical protein
MNYVSEEQKNDCRIHPGKTLIFNNRIFRIWDKEKKYPELYYLKKRYTNRYRCQLITKILKNDTASSNGNKTLFI